MTASLVNWQGVTVTTTAVQVPVFYRSTVEFAASLAQKGSRVFVGNWIHQGCSRRSRLQTCSCTCRRTCCSILTKLAFVMRMPALTCMRSSSPQSHSRSPAPKSLRVQSKKYRQRQRPKSQNIKNKRSRPTSQPLACAQFPHLVFKSAKIASSPLARMEHPLSSIKPAPFCFHFTVTQLAVAHALKFFLWQRWSDMPKPGWGNKNGKGSGEVLRKGLC